MDLFKRAKVLEKNNKPLCLFCGLPFIPDKRNSVRGWGLFCSKSCSSKWNLKQRIVDKSVKIVEEREKKLRQLGI